MKITPIKKKRTVVASKRPKRVLEGTKTTKKGKSTKDRKKTPTIAKLKKELEALQKQIVIKKYGRDCYTCEAKDLQGSNCHLGHVPWPRPDLSIQCKFAPEYTRIQCMVCNIHKGGRGAVALQRMIDEGINVHYLRILNAETKQNPPKRIWYEETINRYKALLEKE